MGTACQTCPSSGLWARLDPSTPGKWRAGQVLAVTPGVRDLGRGRPLAPRGQRGLAPPGSVSVERELLPAPGCGCWKSLGTWWLHRMDLSVTK